MIRAARCRYCDKKVYWLLDADGKKQILDAVAPVFIADGSTPMGLPDGGAEVRRCTRHRGAFVSHFATCPKVDDVKRDRKT